MNQFIKKIALHGIAIAVVVIILLIGLFCITPTRVKADSQGQPQTFLAPTGFPTNLAAGTTSNTLTCVIPLFAGKGVGISWTFNGSTNNSMTIQASVDGTNYFPFSTVAATNALNTVTGANFVTIGTNYSAATLHGLYSLNISAAANTGTIATTNQTPSAPIIVNRPNM